MKPDVAKLKPTIYVGTLAQEAVHEVADAETGGRHLKRSSEGHKRTPARGFAWLLSFRAILRLRLFRRRLKCRSA